jgi:hypothetical protein
MSQVTNTALANTPGATFRSGLNGVLAALQSANSGATAPTTTVAGMFWFDTSTNPATLKQRNIADNGWQLVLTGADVAAMRTSLQLGAAATLGVSANADFTVSPTLLATRETIAAAVAAAVAAGASGIGEGQTWQNMAGSRTHSTTYQNTTGKPIGVFISIDGSSGRNVQVSANNSSWIILNDMPSGKFDISFIVPDGHYYRTQGGSTTIVKWSELR